ncbi:hypothetical protein SOVF_165950 [Spinacia oleracea]|uniref:Uncharacterized protein n=1 Tax=Spinacia oleracea TaxID=3562 RepID=A0A9R0JGS8_SPIOL|nr:uncharacterized protein LOC110805386 [Spinacia oleracea]XP_056685063.1 uncharacterized protein LOC110805386 [Spinacia oleracea]XP_056685064.1 uncharacterized protein LOC110805386 [Spinacia oleracea]KNA08077.1 hypothetical protein SOVF_165950 [Spinacia oleracea]
MALQPAFRERLEDMENTRNQRNSLLQDEKELQRSKSLLLSAKHAKIRLLEQRCLVLDKKFASDNFKISSLKSEIEFSDRQFQTCAQQLRDLKVEVEELEQLEEEREKIYAVKCSEMNAFKDEIQNYAEEIGRKVRELRCGREKLKSCYSGHQERNSETRNHDIQAAKARNSELLALKQNIASSLESNKRVRATLQVQVQSLW